MAASLPGRQRSGKRGRRKGRSRISHLGVKWMKTTIKGSKEISKWRGGPVFETPSDT
jgi:hypothetical protein